MATPRSAAATAAQTTAVALHGRRRRSGATDDRSAPPMPYILLTFPLIVFRGQDRDSTVILALDTTSNLNGNGFRIQLDC